MQNLLSHHMFKLERDRGNLTVPNKMELLFISHTNKLKALHLLS